MSEATELLEQVGGVFYHGTTHRFDRFDPEFTGRGNDQEGPGFYFSSREEDARAYAYPSGRVLTVRLNFRNTLPPKGGITPKVKQQALQLLKAAPDLEDTLSDWGEDPNKALQQAYKLILDRDDALDVFTQIWYDFYRNSGPAWVRGMVSLGYDGVVIPRTADTVHAVVYNPDIIEVVNVTEMSQVQETAAELLQMAEANLSPLEARSKEEFNNLVRTMDQNERNSLIKFIEDINLQGYAQRLGTQNPVLLYHGSPQEAIAKEGLRLGKGRRTSMVLPGLASEYEVENLGIFMTDDLGMAHYFGSNRSKLGHDYKVYQAYANLDHMVDISAGKFPRGLVKLGCQLLSQHYGQPKKNIAQSEVFWLLDQPEFISAIKQMGYTSVRFKEAQSTRRDANTKAHISSGTTIMVLDPRLLVVKSQQNDTLKTLDDVWNHVQAQRGAAIR